jgi:pyrimidine-nucleoside phosphorylase
MTAGVGRVRETDDVDALAGIVFDVASGDAVKLGDVLARVYATDNGRREAAAEQLRPLITILETKTAPTMSEPSIILGTW